MDELHIKNWNEYFLRLSYLISQKSKDNSTKIGSVIVKDRVALVQGFNGIPMGCSDNIEERNVRPEKYFWYEHSERNCLYFAARNGIRTLDSELFTLSIPCADCARGIINSGISKVVYHVQHNSNFELENPKWTESCRKSLKMFDESGIRCVGINVWLGLNTLINGKIIEV